MYVHIHTLSGAIHWEGIETGPLLTVGTSSTQILTLKNYFHENDPGIRDLGTGSLNVLLMEQIRKSVKVDWCQPKLKPT